MGSLLWFDIMDLMDDDPDWSITKPIYPAVDNDEDVIDFPDYRISKPEKVDDTNSVVLRRIVYNPDGTVKKIYHHRYVVC